MSTLRAASESPHDSISILWSNWEKTVEDGKADDNFCKRLDDRVVCSSPCRIWPNLQKNVCWLCPALMITPKGKTLFLTKPEHYWGMIGQTQASLLHSWHGVVFSTTSSEPYFRVSWLVLYVANCSKLSFLRSIFSITFPFNFHSTGQYIRMMAFHMLAFYPFAPQFNFIDKQHKIPLPSSCVPWPPQTDPPPVLGCISPAIMRGNNEN